MAFVRLHQSWPRNKCANLINELACKVVGFEYEAKHVVQANTSHLVSVVSENRRLLADTELQNVVRMQHENS
jgi:hypothetical protein